MFLLCRTRKLLTSSSWCQQLYAALSRYKDFEKGVDTVETAGDRTLVDGRLQSIGVTSKFVLAFCLAFELQVWCLPRRSRLSMSFDVGALRPSCSCDLEGSEMLHLIAHTEGSAFCAYQ